VSARVSLERDGATARPARAPTAGRAVILPVTAVVAWVAGTAAGLVGLWLRATGGAPVIETSFGFGDVGMVAFVVLGATWAGVGALLVIRRPDNTVGRFMVLIGFGDAASVLTAAITFHAVAHHDSSLAGAAGWWTVVLSSLGQLVLYLGFIFPTGRGPTKRWDRVGRLFLLGMAIVFAWLLTIPGPLHLFPGVENPFPIGPDLRPVLGSTPGGAVEVFSLVLVPLLVGSVATRYRRADRVERLQLVWVMTALVLSGAALVGVTVAAGDSHASQAPLVAYAVVGTAVPIAIGVAILRYRLYEIDRIVSRTISWALVTGILVGAFVVAVIGLEAALAGVTQGRTLAVAASTLTAFALFQPVRRRVQRLVDRHFYRSADDAARSLEELRRELRDEVDLDRAAGSLVDATRRAVHPAAIGVWMRQPRS